jgi:hypothetical protein
MMTLDLLAIHLGTDFFLVAKKLSTQVFSSVNGDELSFVHIQMFGISTDALLAVFILMTYCIWMNSRNPSELSVQRNGVMRKCELSKLRSRALQFPRSEIRSGTLVKRRNEVTPQKKEEHI